MILLEFIRQIFQERIFGLVPEIEIVEIKEFLVRKIVNLEIEFKGLNKIYLKDLKIIKL